MHLHIQGEPSEWAKAYHWFLSKRNNLPKTVKLRKHVRLGKKLESSDKELIIESYQFAKTMGNNLPFKGYRDQWSLNETLR